MTAGARLIASIDIAPFLPSLGVTQNQFFINTATILANSDFGSFGAVQQFVGFDQSPQFRIETNTPAVNYLLVRGGIASSAPVITADGADTNIAVAIAAKGGEAIWLGNGAGVHLRLCDLGNGFAENYFNLAGNGATLPPHLGVDGLGTNIDLQILPKGTGVLQFGNAGSLSVNGSVATVLGSLGPVGSHTTVQEWLAIKNSGGTVRYIPLF